LLLRVAEGASEGVSEGASEGVSEGKSEGLGLGGLEGDILGTEDGDSLGLEDGDSLGFREGAAEGDDDGRSMHEFGWFMEPLSMLEHVPIVHSQPSSEVLQHSAFSMHPIPLKLFPSAKHSTIVIADIVGLPVGAVEGDCDGNLVGFLVGAVEGMFEGVVEGAGVGVSEGAVEGVVEGSMVTQVFLTSSLAAS